MRPDRDTELTDEAAPAPVSVPRETYEPPRLDTLGTVADLTLGVVPSGPDISVIGSASDRRLKRNVEPVAAGEVLAGVVALASRD